MVLGKGRKSRVNGVCMHEQDGIGIVDKGGKVVNEQREKNDGEM